LNLDWWPRILRPLVEQHGGEAVERVGFAVLGYPPAWVHTPKEALAISRKLEKLELPKGA